ncbi:hypothetical protein GCM10009808_16690 [Microbacterium sediminicola]|uniref:Elongation factor G-binding protein C-terminal treble-clef zinc-finger domain-containing protein n=1 Tax=Microbacterium sediminicola TaxID=415210 RepID=A0ABN2I711_9MICO
MHSLTQEELRAVFVNAAPDELSRIDMPLKAMTTDWYHLDFLAWRDPEFRGRGYLVAEVDGQPTGIVVRAADSSSRARSGMCNLCHTMQPGNQVSLFTARKAGDAGKQGDSVGTYICVDLSCHDNVRLAAPLAPSEIRASVDMRIDGTRRRTEAFVARVLEEAA